MMQGMNGLYTAFYHSTEVVYAITGSQEHTKHSIIIFV